ADGLAHLDHPLCDLAADAERLIHLVPGLHSADVAVGLRGFVITQLDGAYGPRRLGGRLVVRASAQHYGDRYGQMGRGKRWFHDDSSVGQWMLGAWRRDGAGCGGL